MNTYWHPDTFKDMLEHTTARTARMLVQGAGKDCLGRGGPLDLWLEAQRLERQAHRRNFKRIQQERLDHGILKLFVSRDMGEGDTGWTKYALVRAVNKAEALRQINAYSGGYWRHPEWDCQPWRDDWKVEGYTGNGIYLVSQRGGDGG